MSYASKSMLLVVTTLFFSNLCYFPTKAAAQNPPAYYSIQVLPTPGEPGNTLPITEMNNNGMIVGRMASNNPYLFDSTNGLFYDLNQDSGLIAQLPSGSSFNQVNAINDDGAFVGRYEDGAGDYWAFVVDTDQSLDSNDWTVTILPDLGATRSNGIDINTQGDILVDYRRVNGTKDLYIYNPWLDGENGQHPPIDLGLDDFDEALINNSGQVAYSGNDLDEGIVFLFDWSTNQTTSFPVNENATASTSLNGFNDSGVFCGFASIASLGKITAYRFDQQFEALPSASHPNYTEIAQFTSQGINNAGDIHYYDRTGLTRKIKRHQFPIIDAHLIHAGTTGNLNETDWNLDDLIDPNDPLSEFWTDATIKQVFAMNDRSDSNGASGFPQMTVMVYHPQSNGSTLGTAVLLTPIGAANPSPGISVSPTSGLVTNENGQSDSFEIVLDSQPLADVTIGLTSSNTDEGTVNVSSITFTPANWNSSQSVSIVGVDDAIQDGDVVYTIITAAATSSDPDYNGLDPENVSVTNEDDDTSSGGGSELYPSNDPPIAIPDNDNNGINSNILADEHLITNLTVNIDITHERLSDLDVYLIGPAGGPPVQLFNFTGANAVTDFNGTSSLGLWTLEVYDTRKKKTGTLEGWSITVEY